MTAMNAGNGSLRSWQTHRHTSPRTSGYICAGAWL